MDTVAAAGGRAAKWQPREWRWPALFAALVMALTALPYLVAVSRQTDAWHFGGFLFGVEDGNSYIADMGQGARGAWLFTLPYSSEPHPGVLMFSFYLALGRVAGPDHDAQVLAFHAARLVCGWAMLMVSYGFLAEFLPRVKQRRLALALVALGGGLGWLLVLLGQSNFLGSLPVDFISPEAFSFLTLYGLPHLAAARCFFLLALLAHLRRRPVWAGLALLALSLIQPLYVLAAWAIMLADVGLGWLLGHCETLPRISRIGSNWFLRNSCNSWLSFFPTGLGSASSATQAVSSALVPMVISSPLVIYTTVILGLDPVLKYWMAQNRLPSPHPLHYLLAYGVYLVLAVWGWRALTHRPLSPSPFLPSSPAPQHSRSPAPVLLLSWALVVPFLLYAPISTQRRLVEGFQLPLVILAVWALTVSLHRSRRWLVPLTLALTLPTSVVLLASGLAGTLRPAEPVYHAEAELEMFSWLRAQAAPGQVALSAYDTGNVLPAYTPLIAYIGHGPETIQLEAKAPRVAKFYQAGTSEADRRALLSDGRVSWVIVGPAEKALGDFDPAADPSAAAYLRREYSAEGYAVYRVMP